MEAFAKTSGSKGMQVYLPLNTAATYEQTREFSRGLAYLLERRSAGRVVVDMNKARRVGKVFVDWSQNDRHKTTVNVYSLRAMEQPTVSTPLSWDEVSDALDAGDPEALRFTAPEVLERVAEVGDLFADVQTLEQELPGTVPLSGCEPATQPARVGTVPESFAPGPTVARTSRGVSSAPQRVQRRRSSSVPPQPSCSITMGGPSGA